MEFASLQVEAAGMIELAGGLATRYAFLLQPVKDLAKNWDIDIESCLADCIGSVLERGDGSEEHSSFLEAGMLIQGISDVYCRKIDYVYQLAVSFSDQLRLKMSRKRKSDYGSDDGVEDGVAEDDDVEMEAAFDQHPTDPCVLIDFTLLRPVDSSLLTISNDFNAAATLPVLPMSLVPLAEFEKMNMPLFARRNSKELIGQKDDFRINTGIVHRSGALLLDLANARLLLQSNNQDPITDAADGSMMVGEEIGDSTVMVELQDDTAAAAVEGAMLLPENEQRTCRTYVASEVQQPSEQVTVDSRNSGYPDEGSIVMECDVGNWSDGNEFFKDMITNNDDCPLMRELDMIADEKRCYAPFKETKTCPTIEQRLKRRDKKRERVGLPLRSSILEYMKNCMFRKTSKKNCMQTGTGFSDNTLLAIVSFMRDKHNKRGRSPRSKENEMKQHIILSFHGQVGIEDAAAEEFDMWDEEAGNEYEDDDGVKIALIEPASVDDTPLFADGLNNEDIEGPVALGNVYGDGKAVRDVGLTKPLNRMTYEEVLTYCLQRYWSVSEETTSGLYQRVQKWEEKMIPLLEEEESRREFNIHEYGDEILGKFQQIGQTIPYVELMKGKPWYECCRYLLSILMLANMGNLLVEECNPEDAFGSLRCKLLKRDRHHEVFDDAEAVL
uniref:Condensin-2 complex subunit H2 n=1 Tax=Parascaris univalens TaxID=6257 RepID=A0A914ZWH1_PARUN